ncbi:hypothetical protein D9M71_532140 [compost metagenome]
MRRVGIAHPGAFESHGLLLQLSDGSRNCGPCAEPLLSPPRRLWATVVAAWLTRCRRCRLLAQSGWRLASALPPDVDVVSGEGALEEPAVPDRALAPCETRRVAPGARRAPAATVAAAPEAIAVAPTAMPVAPSAVPAAAPAPSCGAPDTRPVAMPGPKIPRPSKARAASITTRA